MKIGHLELFVKDPLKSKLFYETLLGFKVIDVQHELFVWMKKDNIEILLRPGKNDSDHKNYNESKSGIVFYTEDLEKTRDELLQKGLTFSGTDGSDKCLTFKDPDGNWFQLVNPEQH